MTGILQPVTLTNFLAHGTDLFVEDESDPGNRNVTLSGTQLSFGGPAINFAAGSLNYLSLNGGTGVNTYTVNNTPDAPAGIDLVTRGSGDVVNVRGTAGKLNISGRAPNAVTVGNNGLLANILADVTISGTSTTLLSVDDSADTNKTARPRWGRIAPTPPSARSPGWRRGPSASATAPSAPWTSMWAVEA